MFGAGGPLRFTSWMVHLKTLPFLFWLLTAPAFAAPALVCDQLFAEFASLSLQELVRIQQQGQRRWIQYDRQIRARVAGHESPFIDTGTDANAIGRVYQNFDHHIPNLREFVGIATQRTIRINTYLEYEVKARQILIPILRRNDASPSLLFAALELTKAMSTMLSRVEFPIPTDSANIENPDGDSQNEDGSKDEPSSPPPPYHWGDHRDESQSSNKDLSNSEKSPAGRDVLRTTIRPQGGLLKTRMLDVLFTDGNARLSPLQRPRYQYSRGSPTVIGHTVMVVEDPRQKSFLFPYQKGVVPKIGQYQGFTIVEEHSMEFRVIRSNPNLQEIKVPLIAEPPLEFHDGNSLQFYTETPQIPEELWPEDIRAKIAEIKSKGLNSEEIAKHLSSYFQNLPYRYYSRGNLISAEELNEIDKKYLKLLETLPALFARAHIKTFNCDTAARIGAFLLRSFFGIPAYVVEGPTVRGIRRVNGTTYFVVSSNDPNHAWISAWTGSEWKDYDFTPLFNEPSSAGGEKDDLEPLDSTTPELRQQGNEDSSGGSSQSENGNPAQSLNDIPNSNSTSNPENSGRREAAETPATHADSDGEESGESELVELLRKSRLRQSLRNDSLGPFISQVITIYGIEQMFRYSDRPQVLRNIVGWGKSIPQSVDELVAAFNDSLNALRNIYIKAFAHIPEVDAAGVFPSLTAMVFRNELTEAYSFASRIMDGFSVLNQFRELTNAELDFVQKLQRFLELLQRFKHPDSGAYELANRFLSRLPGTILQRWVYNRYGSDVGVLGSLSTKTLAEDLLKGELRILQLAIELQNEARLYLQGETIPTFKDERTYNREESPHRLPDIVIANSIFELPQFLLNPKPGDHILGPLLRGEQYALGQYRTERVPDHVNPIELITLLMYEDTSPSMVDPPFFTAYGVEIKKLDLQSALAIAVVSISMSKMDPTGTLHTHIIYDTTFGDSLGKTTKIENTEDALNFINERVFTSPSIISGTNIQNVLQHFYSEVALAYAKQEASQGLRLGRANLLLMGDGGAPVDLAVARGQRDAVPGDFPLMVNFLGVLNTSAELPKLAREEFGRVRNKRDGEPPSPVDATSQTSVAANSPISDVDTTVEPYRNIDNYRFADVVEAATWRRNPRAFASNLSADLQLKIAVQQLLSQSPLIQDINITTQILALARTIRYSDKEVREQLVSAVTLADLEAFVGAFVGLTLPENLRQKIVMAFLQSYPLIAERPLNRMIMREIRAFKSLLQWAGIPDVIQAVGP